MSDVTARPATAPGRTWFGARRSVSDDPIAPPIGAAPDAVDVVSVEPVVVDDGPVRAGRRLLAAEAGVALVALVLNLWSLDRNGYGNSYYAAAARSMTKSWSNFFFGAFDPGGWITVDKPPAALWFQAASAKVFGFSSWSLLVPSALAGAGAVWLLAVTIRRVWGPTAGLVAGAALALTPVAVAVSRSNNPDAVLVFFVVAAAWATERSITTRRARWMVAAGALCGFAFLAKLLAAGLVMPGLWLAYLVAARVSWRRRVVHLALATAAFAGVAGIWVGAVQFTPASSRPYIGGSTDGTALDLVLGYNGLGRVTGNEAGGPGGGGGGPGGAGGRPVGFGPAGGTGSGFVVDEFGGSTGIGRLFNNGMGDQVMWLAPAAAAAALAAAAVAVRRRRLDARVGSLVLWAGWAGVTYLLFAYAAGIFHNYYVSLLAPAVAALVGIGVGLAVRAGRLGRVAMAGTLAATAALQVVLVRRVSAYGWLAVLVPVASGAVALGWLVLAARRGPLGRRLAVGAVAASASVALLAPAVWAVNGTRVAQSGTFPAARPSTGSVGAGGPGGFPGGAGGPGGTQISSAELDWLRSQRTTERWILAVRSSMEAGSAIIAGDSLMAIGGFSGGDDSLSADRLAQLVEGGELRFVSASAGGGFGGFGGPGGGGSSTLASVVTQACTNVEATTWGGTGTSAVYDCQGKAAAIRSAGETAASTPTAGAADAAGAPAGGPGGAAPPGFDQIRTCLADKGVTFDPAAGPAGATPEVRTAVEACLAAAAAG